MLTVHHLADSRSQRILWMLEELDLDYEVVRYDRDPVTLLAPPELKAIHPLGKAPILVDDGLVLTESGAIVDYLAERYEALRPPGSPERRAAGFWGHFAEGSAMTPLMLKLYARRLGDAGAELRARADEQISLILGFVQRELADSPYLAGGELSVADIMMSYPLEAASARFGLVLYPGLAAYLERLHARPAYQAALERGGPYQVLR